MIVLYVEILLDLLKLPPPADQVLLLQIRRDRLSVSPGAVRPLVSAILREIQLGQLLQLVKNILLLLCQCFILSHTLPSIV